MRSRAETWALELIMMAILYLTQRLVLDAPVWAAAGFTFVLVAVWELDQRS